MEHLYFSFCSNEKDFCVSEQPGPCEKLMVVIPPDAAAAEASTELESKDKTRENDVKHHV